MALVQSYTLSSVPADSQYLVVACSSYLCDGPLPVSAAAEPVPGKSRGLMATLGARRVRITVKNGDKAVSIVFRAMTNPTLATASAFETDPDAPSAGTYVLAASTTKSLSWCPPTPAT